MRVQGDELVCSVIAHIRSRRLSDAEKQREELRLGGSDCRLTKHAALNLYPTANGIERLGDAQLGAQAIQSVGAEI